MIIIVIHSSVKNTDNLIQKNTLIRVLHHEVPVVNHFQCVMGLTLAVLRF